MALRLDHLTLDDPLPAPASGAPMQLAIDTIEEDPDQPRREFDPQALQELAGTIADRGVRQPISVRPHPAKAGRWLLNFGARRLRASKLAGKTEIPAFVDSAADSYDQVIENEQRESLKPLELALFVQKQMHAGTSLADIAKRLGKSRGYLTFIGALIDPPDWLLDLYRNGRCRGITELYELRKLHDAQPEAVAQWLPSQAHVARADVQALKERLKLMVEPVGSEPSMSGSPSNVIALGTQGHGATATAGAPSVSLKGVARPRNPSEPREPREQRHSELALLGEVDGVTVRVLLDPLPGKVGCVFVVDPDGAQRRAVAIAAIARLQLAML
jgi:ParB family transcriptional regulator, chromosome partitioning protein